MSDDQSQDVLPEVALRIPGQWENPQQLIAALPEGFSLVPPEAPERLLMPDGGSVAIGAVPPDEEFAAVFASGCRRLPSPKDREAIVNYTMNVCLMGPGGSLEAAHRMLVAGAAIVRAGGAGVFVDNSGVAHGSDDWLKLAGDPDNTPGGDWGGVYWAFVASIGSKTEVWSVGMHVLGFRDAIIPRAGDDEADHFTLNNFLGFSFRSGESIADGDLLGDETTPMFRATKEPTSYIPPGNPMFNPYGQWRLERVNEDGQAQLNDNDDDDADLNDDE